LAFHRYPQVIRSVCNLNQFGPSRPVTGAAACPWVAHTVSGLPGATLALFTLGFPVAAAVAALTSPRLVTRRVILQKARDHRGGQASLRLSLHGRGRFQGLFHSPRRGTFHRSLTVLCAIGHDQYGALDRGRPGFPRGFSSLVVLELRHHRVASNRLRDCHPLRCAVPGTSRVQTLRRRSYDSTNRVGSQPQSRKACQLGTRLV
jgi:hypothetical protein